MRQLSRFALALLLPWGKLLIAQTDSGRAGGLTLREAIDSALRNNPDALLARSIADSARSEVRIARAIPNPTYAGIPNTPYQYSLTIPLDLWPQRMHRVRASSLGASAVEADVRDNARQVTLAVQRSFYDVLLADAIRDIVRTRRGIVQQVAAADSARVRAGDLPERALIRSQVELVRTEADVARAGINAQISRLTLQGLMGAPVGDTALRLAGDLRYRGAELPDTGASLLSLLTNRPDITASRTRESQSHETQQLARSFLFPIPQFSVVRQLTAPFESGSYTSLGISFEVPILNLYGGQRERASAGVRSAEYQRRRVETQAVREARAALAELSAQRALVGRYEGGVIAKVRENVAATRYAYERGAASLLDVLDALRAQQDVTTDYSTALHDYWVAVRAAEAALGLVP